MTKNARKSDPLQLVDEPRTAAVEILLPILGAFSSIERSFLEICVDAGQQVLSAVTRSPWRPKLRDFVARGARPGGPLRPPL